MSLPVAAWRLARFAVVAVGDVPLLPQWDWCKISLCSVRRHPLNASRGSMNAVLFFKRIDESCWVEGALHQDVSQEVHLRRLFQATQLVVCSTTNTGKACSSRTVPSFPRRAYLHIFNACHSRAVGCDGLVLNVRLHCYRRDLSSAEAPAVGSDCSP